MSTFFNYKSVVVSVFFLSRTAIDAVVVPNKSLGIVLDVEYFGASSGSKLFYVP